MTSTDTLCTHCKAKLNIEESMLGTTVRCPTCEFTFEATSHIADTDRYAQEEAAVRALPGQENHPENSSIDGGGNEANEGANDDDPNEGPWFVRLPGGEQFGPVSREELDTWVEQGRVDHCCTIASRVEDWSPADLIYPELSIAGSPFGTQPTMAQAKSSLEPHRGAFVLGLAIAGCVVPFLSVWPAVLGTRDLRRMSLGKMDPSGDAMTRSGQAIAMVSSMIWIGAFAIALLAMLIKLLGNL